MSTKQIKEGNLLRFFKRHAKKLVSYRFKLPNNISGFLFKERLLRKNSWEYIKSKIYYENLMRYRCKELGKNFMLFGELPYITGNGDIFIGDNVEMHDKVALYTGGSIYENPILRIGDNTSIGFDATIRVAQKVVIGNNCLIASRVRISDNDGHPLVPARRSHNLQVSKEDVKPVIIEDDVWIGENSIILKGVTIGKGSIISAGSVVLKPVPPMKIVMGNPARSVMWVPENDVGE